MPTDFFATDTLDDLSLEEAPDVPAAGRGAGGASALPYEGRSLEGTRMRLFDRDDESEKKEKSVSFDKKEKPGKDAKDQRGLIHLTDSPGATLCCALVKSGVGQNMFCTETVEMGKDHCRFKTHETKLKAEVAPGWFIKKPGGRGSYALVDKFIGDKYVSEKLGKSFQDDSKTQEEWTQTFHDLTVHHVMGSEDKVANFGFSAGEVLSVVATPRPPGAKKAGSKLPSPSSGSSGGSSGSWSLSKQMEFNVPKKFGQFEAGIRNIAASLSSKTPSKGEKEALDQGLDRLVETIEQAREGLQDSHDQVVDEFESVLAKLNVLSVAQYGLANQIGLRHDFGKEEGIDTVFDGLRYLETLLTRKEGDVEDVKVRMERLDQDKRSFQTSLDKARDEVAELRALNVKDRMDDVDRSLITSMESLKTNFIVPFTRLRSQWKGTGTTNGSVLFRLEEVEKRLSSGHPGPAPATAAPVPVSRFSQGSGASQAALEAVMKRMEALEHENAHLKASLTQGLARVTSLEDSDGPGIFVAGTLWTGSTQCEAFLQNEMSWEDGSPFMAQDFVSMLHSLNADDSAQDTNSVLSRDHHASKGGFTNMGAVRVYSSMQQAHPAPFAGKGSSPLPGLTSYTDWDRQDNRNGKRNKLESQMISLGRSSQSLINSLITSSTAKSLFVHLINASLEHWRQLSSFLSNCYTESKALGSDAKEAWTFACEVVRGVFMELHSVRNVGAERSNIKSLTVQDAGRMLWGILQSHSLMDEIISMRFKGHPKLASYSIDHLFSNRLTPVALETVNDKISKLEANQKTMSSQLGKMAPKKGNG